MTVGVVVRSPEVARRAPDIMISADAISVEHTGAHNASPGAVAPTTSAPPRP